MNKNENEQEEIQENNSVIEEHETQNEQVVSAHPHETLDRKRRTSYHNKKDGRRKVGYVPKGR